ACLGHKAELSPLSTIRAKLELAWPNPLPQNTNYRQTGSGQPPHFDNSTNKGYGLQNTHI
ncbi:hypothetical protein PanWU01x14_132120, partial [Parasponia andersonii]